MSTVWKNVTSPDSVWRPTDEVTAHTQRFYEPLVCLSILTRSRECVAEHRLQSGVLRVIGGVFFSSTPTSVSL
jgi:hypothetical protein